MASINKVKKVFTHEKGAAVSSTNAEKLLRRSVQSCMLWESEFYEEGESIYKRIEKYASQVDPRVLSRIAIEARNEHNLRHVSLLLLSFLCKTGSGSSVVSDTFPQVIKRADELTEFVVIHAKVNGVAPNNVKKVLSAQAKKGLARAFTRFDEYQLAKYNRDGAVKLRDVLFLCHAKPLNKQQDLVWKRLVAGQLQTPDTWEVQLSGGADKKETFERLIQEGKLGYFALLRNLRNMVEAGVDRKLVTKALARTDTGRDKILPFRFLAAARHAPSFEPALDEAFSSSLDFIPELSGTTVVLVDVSGSMQHPLSAKSDLTRMDAACALGVLVRSEEKRVFSFSINCVEVPARKGMAGIDAIRTSQRNNATNLTEALDYVNRNVKYDRIIVITDEQSQSNRLPQKLKGSLGYMINVASYQNGVAHSDWVQLNGFSENIIKYITALES
jgi:60 kDa SS-A/Ro ribonucleoprotein